MIKTENNVIVPSNSISLRSILGKKSRTSITFIQKSHCTNHKMMKTENKNDKKKSNIIRDSYFASENNRFSMERLYCLT